MARAAFEFDPEAFQVVAGCQCCQNLDIATVAGAAVEVDDPRRIDPCPGLDTI
jgi:hypothetical protein